MRNYLLLAAGACALVAAQERIDVEDGSIPGLEDALKEASASGSSVVESVSSSVVASSSSSTTKIQKPTFTPTTLKAPLLEQFTDDWEDRWKESHAKKENTEEEWAYVGKWAVEEPTLLKGIKGDKGLVLKNKAAHHAISSRFTKPVDNKGKTLVVQYEAKFQAGLECGGAYMKLLKENKALKTDEFSNASPYVIMFGPDKCGSTNKVHFIFKHKNPKTGEYEEKHLKTPPPAKIGVLTTLYTLIVKPDQTFQILINGVSARNGSLLEDFSPAVNPDKEIDDPEDKKPSDWVDEQKIPDPEATKPEDWDEDAPFEIPDEDAVKPDDWLEDEPKMVNDPEAVKPADWDDEEDGDWQPPKVPNPKCEEVSGCGPWERPNKKNPAYKGQWTAPMIDNPKYKGIWKPQKIANPAFFEDNTPSNLEPIGAVGFELWTMQNDILFDNIYIGHSIEDAKALQAETFDVKSAIEKQEEEIEQAKTELASPKDKKKPASPNDLKFMDDPVFYVREKLDLFLAIARRDPVEAVKFVPEIAGGLALGVITILALFLSAAGAGAQKAPSKEEIKAKAKAASKDAQEKANAASEKISEKAAEAKEAVASSVEAAQDEVKKRTTRSSAADK